MAEEYYTFNETLSKLGVSEDELLNLVSSGQLRAFRINHDTKFRIEDVADIEGNAGGSAMSIEESSVVELDDLPEDVVMLEDDSASSAPELSIADDIAEETALAADLEEDSAEDLMIFDESDAQELSAPAEPAPMELSESSEVMDLDSAALDLSEEDSDPALAETVMTDSSAISGTENISLDDDDIEFSTQEITVQEDAISEEEVSAQETVVGGSGVEEEFTEEIDEDEVDYPRRRPAAAARTSAGHRHMQSLDAPKGGKDLLFTGLIGLTVLGMIYPVMMMAWLLFFGATTGRDMISVSEQTYEGKLQNISPLAVPSIFKWMVENNSLSDSLDDATTSTGLKKAPTKAEIEQMVKKIIASKAAESNTPAAPDDIAEEPATDGNEAEPNE